MPCRYCSAVCWAFMVLAGLNLACRQQEPQQPPDEPQGQSTGASTAPAEAPQPGPAEPARTPAEPEPPPAEPVAPVPVDPAQDDPAAPGWFPKPNEVNGWLRTTPLTVAHPDQWSGLDDPALRRLLAEFLLKSASRCRYEAALPAGSGAVAEVVLVEAHQPADSFGLFTNRIPAAFDRQIGSASCSGATPAGGRAVHCWQGPYYLYVELIPGAGPLPEVAVEKLAAALVQPIPSADPPPEVEFLPTQRRIPGAVWVVRRTLDTLPRDFQEGVLHGAAELTAKALGLSVSTLMAIAAYDAGPGEHPNYVWVVSYPTAGEARAAHDRYQAALQAMTPPPPVIIMAPHDERTPTGRFLIGSWNRDQESFMHVMNEVAARIPRP